ncbi:MULTISPECIES: heavy-metal-associated domain-containing protein [Oceanobacillus]|uniref:Heavy metal-binding protein n=2 Tax=Oceanobacillus caeni TaxID=405946 RepID=A0ABR5MMB1_9BACI|nr:heavy-metal-associated domain-containing protein [Oceanobacillus caeni]KKE78818.1 heavy metal-binding protein [Bacilli bacterium VT-13-104]PZD85117.1 copper chaperone [Bacilli bacterium]KPH77570.1 heavy metal-binding protein [Oceanobacillus caeni]MBU8791226.1 heavy-metal-associated domain-containing protein [Oceanobacillus caeni]MED4474190.1 heavy-metal-associated domain-containing protein [Oceanobacillus caeni]
MKTIKFQLEPLTCPSCIKKIETKLGKMDGVEEAKVMFNSSKVKATFNEQEVKAEEMKEVIEKLGYPVLN